MCKNKVAVLLVEDNEDHAELARRALRTADSDCDIYHVKDGNEAIDFLDQKGDWTNIKEIPIPQLILLDLKLPKMDGIEVLKKIRATEKMRHIPVVIISSSDSPRDVAAAYNEHANSFVLKPSNFQDLEKLVTNLRDYWLTWDLGVTGGPATFCKTN